MKHIADQRSSTNPSPQIKSDCLPTGPRKAHIGSNKANIFGNILASRPNDGQKLHRFKITYKANLYEDQLGHEDNTIWSTNNFFY